MQKLWASLRKISLSFIAMILCAYVVVDTNNRDKHWKQFKSIDWDVISYYAYLPAYFIRHDISLKFTETDGINYINAHQYWPEKAPNGGIVIKTTMGIAILYTPFFWLANTEAHLSGQPTDGFSQPYQKWIHLSGMFYFLGGIWFLRKLLLQFYPEAATAVTLIVICLATNLYFYVTENPEQTHSFNFSLMAGFLYYAVKWHKRQRWGYIFALGITAGLIILIRPVNILVLVFPLLLNVTSWQSLRKKIIFLFSHYKQFLVMGGIIMLIWLPQLLYWKHITGQWFFYSYVGERFFFNKPHILEVLLSYRKGWLVYTPVMLFSLIGFYHLYKSQKEVFWATLSLGLIFIYVMSCWWCWWYGGSFGMRPLIDFYALFAIPLAAFCAAIFRRGVCACCMVLAGLAFFVCIQLNFFQTHQQHEGLIHYDSMTKEAYWDVFLRKNLCPDEYTRKNAHLKAPDYKKAMNGEPEYTFNPF